MVLVSCSWFQSLFHYLFEHIQSIKLVFLLLTLNMQFSAGYGEFLFLDLNLIMTMLSSYKNQSIDLDRESIHWFLDKGKNWSLMG